MALNCDGRVLLGPQPLSREEFDAQVKSAMEAMEAQSASANTPQPAICAQWTEYLDICVWVRGHRCGLAPCRNERKQQASAEALKPSPNTTKVTRKQCHAYTERSCGGKCASCNEWY